MTRIHTERDCDETCYCCAECYMATGESVCRKLCPHAECRDCGEKVPTGHTYCAECDADAADHVSDWKMPTDDRRTLDDERAEAADADNDDRLTEEN